MDNKTTDRRRTYTQEDIRHMRELARVGMPYADIMREVGCTYATLYRYTNKKRQKYLKEFNKRIWKVIYTKDRARECQKNYREYSKKKKRATE